MKKNKNAFSLAIAMWIVVVSSLLAYTIIEYMIPFSRNVSWIENATKSYYYANKWIEEWLYELKNRTWANILDEKKLYCTKTSCENISDNYFNPKSLTWFYYETTSLGRELPLEWHWDSEYDKDWNRISISEPINLSVWYNLVDIDALEISFRTPEINSIRPSLMASSTWYISWQLVWPWDILNSEENIKGSFNLEIPSPIKVKDEIWYSFSSSWAKIDGQNLKDFFNNKVYCDNTSNKCILKFSVIRDLTTTDGVVLPYLEWKIENSTKEMPLRYSILETQWKSRGFVRNLKIRYPQDTVNQAFDFAVFQ